MKIILTSFPSLILQIHEFIIITQQNVFPIYLMVVWRL